jgi:hypothetical protein
MLVGDDSPLPITGQHNMERAMTDEEVLTVERT